MAWTSCSDQQVSEKQRTGSGSLRLVPDAKYFAVHEWVGFNWSRPEVSDLGQPMSGSSSSAGSAKKRTVYTVFHELLRRQQVVVHPV